MQRYLLQRAAELVAQQPEGEETVHFTESLAALVVEELSAPGDRVLDPFAGFGTTLAAAERLGRHGVGVELLRDRVEHARGRAPGAEVVQGDARQLDRLVDGPFGLALTSPPYRTRNAHPEDPLTAYAEQGGDHDGYLAALTDVFAQVAGLLSSGGHVVVNVANLRHEGVFTPLAWDLARSLQGVGGLALEQEVYLAWDSLPPDLTGDYLLVLRKD
jgi:DNA modification methylase